MRKDDDAVVLLEASRKRVEERLADVRGSLRREVGWAPSSRSWTVLTLALSAGVALAFLIRSKRTSGQSS